MKKVNWSKLIFRGSLLLCGASLLAIGIEVFSLFREQNRRIESAKSNAKQEVVQASKQLAEKLQKIEDSVNAIARDLTEGKLKDEQLLDRAKQELAQNPDFLEVGAAYQPYAYSPSRRLFAPFYTRKTGEIKLEYIENTYDYSERTPDNEWYRITLEKGVFWNEPKFDKASKAIIADYYAAFYRTNPQTKEKTPAGIIYADYSIDKLNQLFNSLDLGKSGFGYLISKKGVFLVNPNRDYVKNQKNIFDLATERKSQQLRVIGEKATKGESAVIDFVNDITGQSAWVFIEPIPLTGWSIAVVAISDDVIVDNQTRRQQLIRIALEMIAFLFFLFLLVLRPNKRSFRIIWAVSSVFTVLCVGGIGFIWYLALSEQNYKTNRNLLLSKASVNNLLRPQVERAAQLKQKPPLYVPTGVFVQAIKFNSANDVFVYGYIWQKYQDGVHDGLSRGFVLPEGSDLKLTESYRYKENQTEVIGWYFETTLRKNFDFSNYPFDYNDVWIRLWPKDVQRNDLNRTVILVPDLDAYEVLNPIYKAGLERDFVSESWKVESSFFEYKFNDYNTDFGMANHLIVKNFPELYFTVIFKRAFIGILIARIVPLSVVAILLFIMMLMSREHGMEVVGSCAGFIFIVILDQIALRGQVAAHGIIYFEYFYFVVYLLILLVAVNSILLNQNKNIWFIQYKDNQIPTVLYWPTLLGILLIITASIFY